MDASNLDFGIDSLERLVNFLSPSISTVSTSQITNLLILSVRISPLLEHIQGRVSEMENDDPLGLDAVKLCLLVFDPIGYLWITNIYLLLQFQAQMSF